MGYTYLAIDIGASSGRHILGKVQDGRLILTEVHRFTNGMAKQNGALCWDYEHLFGEILEGIRKCAGEDAPVSLGIDTWGVDYVLLDGQGCAVGPTFGYRDSRTAGMDAEVGRVIRQEDLYARTGILKASYNTIYQLMADKIHTPERPGKAEHLLMVPDYLNYLLTGVMKNEYTEATTSQLIDPGTQDWDKELIRMLGYPEKIFGEIVKPGTVIGPFSEGVRSKTGLSMDVTAVGSHDTASAVAAIPDDGDADSLYISSGTWSLMGVVRQMPDCSAAAGAANFTNEGGCADKICFHKNIMGLWMIQSVRHEYDDRYSFAELCDLAEQCSDYPSRVDVNDDLFLAPESMKGALQDYCRRTGQPVPGTPGEYAAVVYRSLAECYARTAEEIEQLTGRHYKKIMIVGGGSNAAYLNQLTASASGRTVYAGIGEATSIGNIVAQMIARGELGSYAEAKELIAGSFPMKVYEP